MKWLLKVHIKKSSLGLQTSSEQFVLEPSSKCKLPIRKTTQHHLTTMERVLLFVLLAGVCVFARPSQEDAGECAVAGSYRRECGWLGIDKQTCLKRGCCWDTSDRNAKYCFVKKGKNLLEGQCPVAPSERQECGYRGITRDQCLKRYCCWDDSVPNTKWCFQEPISPKVGCYIYHGISGVCRYTCHAGESKAFGMYTCGGRICCHSRSYGK